MQIVILISSQLLRQFLGRVAMGFVLFGACHGQVSTSFWTAARGQRKTNLYREHIPMKITRIFESQIFMLLVSACTPTQLSPSTHPHIHAYKFHQPAPVMNLMMRAFLFSH